MAGKKNLNRRLALGGGAALLLGSGYLFARGQGGHVSHAKPERGTFHRGNVNEPFTLDPTLSDASWEFDIIGDLMMGLTTEDSAGHPIPGMDGPLNLLS